MVLFKELLLYRDVVVRDTQHNQPILRALSLLHAGFITVSHNQIVLAAKFGDKLILNQNERFHRVLESKLMLAHLGQDRTDVQVDIARVRNLKAVVHGLLAEMQVVIFNLESLLQVGQCRAQFLGPAENAGEIVVSDSAVPIAFVCVDLRFLEKLERDSIVLFLKEGHRKNIADDSGFTAGAKSAFVPFTEVFLLDLYDLFVLLKGLEVLLSVL